MHINWKLVCRVPDAQLNLHTVVYENKFIFSASKLNATDVNSSDNENNAYL